MDNKDKQGIRKTLNTDAKLHLDNLKHPDHIREHSLLDDKIAHDIANNNIPDPSDDFMKKAADVLGDTHNHDNT